MLNKKDRKRIKIIIGALIIIDLLVLGYYLLDAFVLPPDGVNFYNEHFCAMICLFIVGVIALLLPMVGTTKYGDGKGDSMMIVVGFLLMLCAIISVIYSFLGI